MYRCAWCFNLLDMEDSARVYAERALTLSPASERCLAELLKALAGDPESVVDHSFLVQGGGVCRYRLARAEMEMDILSGESLLWLINEFESGDSSSAADAGCWLSILFPDKGLQFIIRSVDLAPDEQFYRYLLIEKLIEADMIEEAAEEFSSVQDTAVQNLTYWQTSASLHEALEQPMEALEDSRKAFLLRQIPATGADLGWRLYFAGRDLVRSNRMTEAVPLLMECSNVWSKDSSWALRADSLLDLINEYTSISGGFGEPI